MKKEVDDYLKELLNEEWLMKEDTIYRFPIGSSGVVDSEGRIIESSIDVKIPKGTYFPQVKSGMYDWVIENLNDDPVRVFKRLGFVEFL